jgi:hypothetical protein
VEPIDFFRVKSEQSRLGSEMNCRSTSHFCAVSHLTAKLIKAVCRPVAVTMLVAVSSAHFTAELFGQPSRRLYKVTNKDKKVGFIDKTGKLVIGFDRLPAGTEVGSFSEGFAPICSYDKPPSIYTLHCGYIDETGSIVIPPRFVLSSQFSEGLAWIRTETLVGFKFMPRSIESAAQVSNHLALLPHV